MTDHIPAADPRISVTVLTGFLGAGKTTLLNRVLSENHGRKIAVIENEFGPEGIDNELLVHEPQEQIVEMNNGCLCCTVRGDLVAILGTLQERRSRSEIAFDHVVIETTGIADPGPVLQTFFLDADIARHYTVDGVITVVDALHGTQTLDSYPEAQAQIGFADRLLLSKTDLVDPAVTDALTARIININPHAPIRAVNFGETPIEDLLSVGGFDLDAALDIKPDLMHHHGHHDTHGPSEPSGHGGHDSSGHGHARHDDSITSFSFTTDKPFDPQRLEHLLAALAEGYGPDLLRHKGVLSIHGLDHRVIVQGVQWVVGSDSGRPWEQNAPRISRMVFIGRDIDRDSILDSLSRCLVQ